MTSAAKYILGVTAGLMLRTPFAEAASPHQTVNDLRISNQNTVLVETSATEETANADAPPALRMKMPQEVTKERLMDLIQNGRAQDALDLLKDAKNWETNPAEIKKLEALAEELEEEIRRKRFPDPAPGIGIPGLVKPF